MLYGFVHYGLKSAYIIFLNLMEPSCQWVSNGGTLYFHLSSYLLRHFTA